MRRLLITVIAYALLRAGTPRVMLRFGALHPEALAPLDLRQSLRIARKHYAPRVAGVVRERSPGNNEAV